MLNQPINEQSPAQPVAHSQQNMSINFVSTREVAEILKISPLTVYRMVENRSLPVYRIARRLRFRKQDLLNYLEKNRYGSAED